MAGGVGRLWPHVKTHKCAALVRMQISRGIERFKCATIAEVEMCAAAGAPHVLLAYPLAGPAVKRFITLREKYSGVHFWAVGDSLECLSLLGKLSKESGQIPVDFLVDVNVGMNRTGVSLNKLEEFYRAAAALPGLHPAGFHCYDGHLGIKNLDERKKTVAAAAEPLWEIKKSLEKSGFELPVLVMGGTPTFPCHKETPDVYLSPGTCFVHDAGYSKKYPDMEFTAGAAILSRVISHPGPAFFTLDTGYKAIASEQSERGIIAGLPGAIPVAQSEEHWVWQIEGEIPPIDSIVYIIPNHICPTTALYPGVYVIRNHELTDYWEITARNRKISI
jgi:D-serine deaminase-like pyridoxal phosphate-dependent protein